MKKKPKFTIRDSAIYNKVWRSPIGRLKSFIKSKCENLSPKQRLTIVTVLFSAFVLTAFFVFGHACYKIGLGQARKAIEVEHIAPLEISPEAEAEYDMVSKIKKEAYESFQSENEAQ